MFTNQAYWKSWLSMENFVPIIFASIWSSASISVFEAESRCIEKYLLNLKTSCQIPWDFGGEFK